MDWLHLRIVVFEMDITLNLGICELQASSHTQGVWRNTVFLTEKLA